MQAAGKRANLSAIMLKAQAIQLLGGSVTAAADAVGITPQAISQWPETLPPRIADRVQAALARMKRSKQRKATELKAA